MRALEREVVDAIWAAIEPLLPPRPVPTRWAVIGPGYRTSSASGGILIRLVTGASWVDIEAILDHQVSDTTHPGSGGELRSTRVDSRWRSM
jgi:transposase